MTVPRTDWWSLQWNAYTPGCAKPTRKLSPTGWFGRLLPGSESIPKGFGASPVTEWTTSGPVQYQVTLSPRSMWTSSFDHW